MINTFTVVQGHEVPRTRHSNAPLVAEPLDERAALTALDTLDGRRAAVVLQGQRLTGVLQLAPDSALDIIFDEGQTYFGQDRQMVFSPDYNNWTPHVLDLLVVHD